MPRNDGTGPRGEGSQTGRGMGLCQSENKENTVTYGRGRFCGQRRFQNQTITEPLRMGRRCGRMNRNATTQKDDLNNQDVKS